MDSIMLGSVFVQLRGDRAPRLIAHDKAMTKKQLRKPAYRCVDELLRTWKRGDEFVLGREPIGSIKGNPQMARMKFQTGQIEVSLEDER